MTTPSIAVFRPDDERLESARSTLDSLGAETVADPMLSINPTGATPRVDADHTVFTSRTGVEIADDADWSPSGSISAIGDRTASHLSDRGYTVDVVPETFSSVGLIEALADRVDGVRIDVARSDHGSPVLLDGLNDAGAYVHETVLYELCRPPEAGRSVELAAAGALDGALFTSSLTVEHFVATAADDDRRTAAIEGLNDAVVGAIGTPTCETATELGIDVGVVPERATFEALAAAVAERISTEE